MSGLRLLALLVASSTVVVTAKANASPIKFNMTFSPSVGPASPLFGGVFSLDLTLNPDTLTPTTTSGGYPIITDWPASNTSAVLTITGTAALNGVYPGAASPGARWQLARTLSIDHVEFPIVSFEANGNTFRIQETWTTLPTNTWSFSTHLYPIPFQSSQVIAINRPDLFFNSSRYDTQVSSSSAVAIPEPPAIALAAWSLVAAGAHRRRRLT